MHFIVVSHGPFAKAALQSTEMIIGEQENVTTFEVSYDTTLEGMAEDLKKVIEIKGEQNIVVFCDILGGTPANACVKNLNEFPELSIVTGFNLPVLVESFMFSTNNKEELLAHLKKTHEESLTFIKPKTNEKESIEEYEL